MRGELTTGYACIERSAEFIMLSNERLFCHGSFVVKPSEPWKKRAVFVCRPASRNADARVCDKLTLSRAPGHSFW